MSKVWEFSTVSALLFFFSILCIGLIVGSVFRAALFKDNQFLVGWGASLGTMCSLGFVKVKFKSGCSGALDLDYGLFTMISFGVVLRFYSSSLVDCVPASFCLDCKGVLLPLTDDCAFGVVHDFFLLLESSLVFYAPTSEISPN
jgi:hypothetical protein